VFTAAAFVVWAGRLMPLWPVVFAAIRAVLQLASVSALITAVLVSLVLTGAFLLLMAVVATATSAARTGVGRRGARVGLAITAGVIPALALRLGTGLLPATGHRPGADGRHPDRRRHDRHDAVGTPRPRHCACR
ncbi:MAG TPA: ABC transporter permease, partial [Kutzneria sp.]|nr:ABC transporter permease [Kutzneria sp.]